MIGCDVRWESGEWIERRKKGERRKGRERPVEINQSPNTTNDPINWRHWYCHDCINHTHGLPVPFLLWRTIPVHHFPLITLRFISLIKTLHLSYLTLLSINPQLQPTTIFPSIPLFPPESPNKTRPYILNAGRLLKIYTSSNHKYSGSKPEACTGFDTAGLSQLQADHRQQYQNPLSTC